MASTFHFDKAPPMWWLAAAGPHTSAAKGLAVSLDDRLHLGSNSVRLGEVSGFEHRYEKSNDVEGLLIAGAGFLGVAMVFLIGVMGFGFNSNFLLAFVFLAFFGCASFVEVLGVKPIGMHRILVWTHSGEEIAFCCSDDDQAERLVALLDAALPDD